MRWLITLLLTMLLPRLALAAPDAGNAQAWWQVLLIETIKATLAIAVPVLSTLVYVLLRRTKLNIELEQLQRIAGTAAGWAEQRAHQALRAQGTPTPSAQKLATALAYGAELARRYGIRQKAVERLEGLIESKLGQQKLTAAPPKTTA